jgi:hypothetical protein
MTTLMQRVEQALSPDVSLTYIPSLKCWRPTLVADWPIVRQLNNGDHRVTDIDKFITEAGKHGLTVETIDRLSHD